MQKILYYISDVGWGHAARSSVIIKRLVKEVPYLKVVVRTCRAADFLRMSLREEIDRGMVKIAISPFPAEPGWPTRYPFTKDELSEIIKRWLSEFKEIAREEAQLIDSNTRLVISDISPLGFEVAASKDIPCVGISNFNWWDEYIHLLQDERLLKPLEEAYSHASWWFLLPLESENRVARLKERVELVAREHNPQRVREIRRSLFRRYKPEMIAAITMGGFYRNLRKNLESAIKEASLKAKILWITPPYLRIEGIVSHTPSPEEFRDTLAACDFILAKFGYSTVSEAITSRIPMILLYRTEIAEDTFATEELVMGECALRFPMNSRFSIPLEEIPHLHFQGLSKRMQNRGAESILRRLKERFL